jgi:hypothetical protein
MSDFLNFCANDSMSSSAHHLGELVGQQSDPPIFEFNLRVFLLPTKTSPTPVSDLPNSAAGWRQTFDETQA